MLSFEVLSSDVVADGNPVSKQIKMIFLRIWSLEHHHDVVDVTYNERAFMWEMVGGCHEHARGMYLG